MPKTGAWPLSFYYIECSTKDKNWRSAIRNCRFDEQNDCYDEGWEESGAYMTRTHNCHITDSARYTGWILKLIRQCSDSRPCKNDSLNWGVHIGKYAQVFRQDEHKYSFMEKNFTQIWSKVNSSTMWNLNSNLRWAGKWINRRWNPSFLQVSAIINVIYCIFNCISDKNGANFAASWTRLVHFENWQDANVQI